MQAEARRAFQHVERLLLATGLPQHAPPSLTCLRRLAPPLLFREEIDRAPIRLVRRLGLVLQRQPVAERPEREPELGRLPVAELLDRLARKPDGLDTVAERRARTCALDLHHRDVFRGRMGAE